MGGIDILLELILVGLLGGTLLHATRLQRSLAALRQDRAALHEAAIGFDGGAREAERSLVRLKEVAEQVERQLRGATALKEDLLFLSDRGERLADQLETLIRSGRGLGAESPPVAAPVPAPASTPAPAAAPRSQAERNLLLALQGRR